MVWWRWRGTPSPASSAASGIITKIDFNARTVAECHSTRARSSVAIRIFMKGKDPRDAHFIAGRICGMSGDNPPLAPAIRRTWPTG